MHHACRSALTADDSPVLLGAGASLAAAFLQRRMAAGDAIVLQRLMMLLTAPLSRLDSPGQVGLRAFFCTGSCGIHVHDHD